MAHPIRIGQREVGPGRPVYFIAEAGSNHDGDLGQAKRLVEVAALAGADAVKFQVFRADQLYPRGAGTSDYLAVPRSIFDVIRDLEMPLEWLPELAEYATGLGIDFLATPFDEAAADALLPCVPAFKIASYEMTHHGLLQHVARTGKPLLFSTGTATLEEVGEAVAAARAAGATDLVVLQCTAKYPAPFEALNLRAMGAMASAFDVLVGFSDHSRAPLPAPVVATALGAVVIEKHFTLSNQLAGPDHAYALEPGELVNVIRRVREAEQTLGSGEKRPHATEEELRRFARRSVFTTAPVAAGERLSRRSAAVLRCGKLEAGEAPREYLRLLGRVARRALPPDHGVRAADLEELRLSRDGVSLRPLAADDADRVVAWRSRPDVHAQMFAAEPPTRKGHDAWYARQALRQDRVELVILDGEEPVGTAGLSAIDFGRARAELGIVVGEERARGRGVAARAASLLLEYAFEALALDEVTLELFADNAPARRLYDRLGFVVVEPAPEPRMKDGRPRPVTRMALARSAWRSRAA